MILLNMINYMSIRVFDIFVMMASGLETLTPRC